MSKICPTCEGTGRVVGDDEIGGFRPSKSDKEEADECPDCSGYGYMQQAIWLREMDAGTDNACWIVCAKSDTGAVAFVAAEHRGTT